MTDKDYADLYRHFARERDAEAKKIEAIPVWWRTTVQCAALAAHQQAAEAYRAIARIWER